MDYAKKGIYPQYVLTQSWCLSWKIMRRLDTFDKMRNLLKSYIRLPSPQGYQETTSTKECRYDLERLQVSKLKGCALRTFRFYYPKSRFPIFTLFHLPHNEAKIRQKSIWPMGIYFQFRSISPILSSC